MPVMGGIQATKEIMNIEQRFIHDHFHDFSFVPQIPKCNIVALTAFVNDENLKACKKAGAVEVHNKPLDASVLPDVIGRFCPKIHNG